MIKQRLTISLCLLLASLVFMSSLHMVQAFSAAVAAQRVNEDAAQGHVKVAPDLHHHMDKSGMQLVKDAGDSQQFYADYRTLRALRNAKKDLPYRYRLAGWFQDSWLQLSTIFG
jgi:hypothetical protein